MRIGVAGVVAGIATGVVAHAAGLHEAAGLAHAATFLGMLVAFAGLVAFGLASGDRMSDGRTSSVEERDAVR